MNKLSKNLLIGLETWSFTIFKIVLIAVYSVIVAAYSNDGLEQDIRRIGRLGDWLMTHPLLVIGSAAGLAIAYQGIYKLLTKVSKSIKNKDDVATNLVVALDIPVNKKRERFAEEVDNFVRSGNNKHTTHKVFKAITKPEEQSILILESLASFLNTAYNNVDFKVGLMSIKNNKIEDWKHFLPITKPPKTPLEILRLKESTISRCVASKHTEIVSDVKKEIKNQKNGSMADIRYVKGNTSEKEQGSQLCYPIISATTKDLIYVVTISASERNFFKESERHTYKWILERFATRIALEHSLECLLHNKL